MRKNTNSRCILILGMHRSGTSALAGVLSHLGVDTGPDLLPPNETVNPKGFWEHSEIVSIHEELLKSMNSSWDDVREYPPQWYKSIQVSIFREALIEVIKKDFSQSSLWVVKDPRMCRLLPMWLDILAQLGIKPYIIINLREPCNVAKSLEVRDEFFKEKAHLLWLRHSLEAELWSRGYPRMVLTYQQLLDDWVGVIRRISEQFSLNLDSDHPEIASRIHSFIEPSLRHHNAQVQVDTEDELSALASETYSRVTTLPLDHLANWLNHVGERVTEITYWAAPWAHRLRELELTTARLVQENTYLESEVARVKATFSWRLTKPFRLIANLPVLIKKIGHSR